MYNLGPLPRNNTFLRLDQGLQSQLLANDCAGCNMYSKKTGCISCKLDMYPAQQVHWNYGMPGISNKSTCVQYLQSP